MRRLDRYIFAQLARALGVFVLIFTGVVWLTQAVRLLDTVVLSGQGARVFVEFSALVLPQVFTIVVPLAGLGAALFTINRLYTEAELVAMMAAGAGPLTLLRPVLMFGAALFVAMATVTIVLVPRGGAALADRTQEIRSDLVSSLLVERQFIHPMDGLTLYIADTGGVGEMAGLFLHDNRDPAQPVTYAAQRALLLRDGMEARLVMSDGVALGRAGGATLNTVVFDQFVFDLSSLLEDRGPRTPRPAEYSVLRLLDPTPAMLERGDYTRASYVSEAHWKIALPLLAFIYPPVALVTLLASPYRRGGFGARIVLAIGVAVLLYAITFVARARAQDVLGLWPLMYLSVGLGAGYVGLLTLKVSRPRPAGAAP